MQRAQHHGIPARCINHREFSSREGFDDGVIEALRAHSVDWVVMAGWMRIASRRFIEAFESRILNIHPSLLPSFKGAHAVEDALNAGVKITGCTVHLVIADLDAGPIIAQAAVPVLPDDDIASLHARIQEQEHALYPRAIMMAVSAHHPSASTP
jgi:phosphoribosylglycinamide formyltransferase 1